MDPREQVAITGLGLVSPLGRSVAESVENAWNGRSGIRPCAHRFPDGTAAQLDCHVAGTVEGFEPELYFEPQFVDRYDRITHLAMAAATEAMADAGYTPESPPSDQMGCVMGTGATGAGTWQRYHQVAFGGGRLSEIPLHAALAQSGNMPSGMIALRYKLRGYNTGVVNACAASLTALSVAADAIRAGRADTMLAGGTEAPINVMLHAAFLNASAMNPTKDPVRASTPFSIDRRGFVCAEGAGVMVLERLSAARARGARVHGILAGDALTNDAHHIINPPEDGAAWAHTMRLALERAGVGPDEVDYVSAHAASTPKGDLAETRALKLALGEHVYRVPVSATKSLHGHAFGATGAIELVLALAAMRRGWVLPTIGWKPDPECDLDYVPHAGRKRRARVLLKSSFGTGGVSSSIVVVRPDA